MNVNGVTNVNDAYSNYKQSETAQKQGAVENASTEVKDNEGVIYEPTLEIPTSTYKANTELINKLKADAEARVSQLQDIVSRLISKQCGAYADATNMWNFLREGNYTVDAETKAQAEADIAEDGYWGVEQTSTRIVDFATALTGGDPSKLEDMREAFKKGYEQAEETWGGKLPEISEKTYQAVMDKFDALAKEYGLTQN